MAQDVWVITVSGQPVRGVPTSTRFIELDAANRIETELSAELPADPEQASAIAKRRLSQSGAELQRRVASAYQGVTDAWSLGITTIPAVVVDQRYVVYGEPDVARAVARIEQHRRAQP
ncbi:TIGR03757 family integrating conjugative element protein [Pseudomonas aeruginosa]|uniref:TIGR03757 family integrating conjugative element protein n=1 Tax=Pseudomonas aeruginosa TaxID=287 RepID=UPI0021013D08|nr:TIGR03757 family integrating conjugative element protein [Pseudomonas aeruginosa]